MSTARGIKKWLRRVGLGVVVLVATAGAGTGVFAYAKTSAYDESTDKVYDIPPLPLTHDADPAKIARGKHLAQSLAGCAIRACHGADLTGGHVTDGGPVGRSVTPNISVLLPLYTDGEVARLIRHGVKKDGRTVRFMISNSMNWLPDADVVALLSYLRTVPVTPRETGSTEIKTFGKVMDRLGYIPIDIARRIDHSNVELGPAPSPTAEYGKWIARHCTGCHGEHMSGGPLPGTPPSFKAPLNLTPDPTGLAGWSYEDFFQVVESGKRKDGTPLAEFMPVDFIRGMDETERHALWAYLQSLPARPFGGH